MHHLSDPADIVTADSSPSPVGQVMAFGDRTDNATLMTDCHQLGYLPEPVLDCTYGKGRFWRQYRPANLTAVDLYPHTADVVRADFRALPFDTGTFGAAVFDPPYKLNGTGGGGGPAEADRDYGVAGAYVPIVDRHALMVAGLREAFRVTRRGGYVLAKCQDQIASGRLHAQTHLLTDEALRLDHLLDDILHVRGYRKQPPGRRQVHARRDYSTLLVFRKGRP